MQADTVQKRLESLPSLSKAGKRVNGLARLRATRTLMDSSVNRTRSNRGSATPGMDGETLDGLTIERINGWIRSMVEGTYHAKPVKRVFIPKANGKLRPLGIPSYADRMVQNAQRDILERIYEPVFSNYSHGFRPGRSCHSALFQIQRYWTATKWFIEVDVKSYFDTLDHGLLLNLLRKRVDDESFIATLQAQLQAGVMEKLSGDRQNKRSRRNRWEFRKSYSGVPQGGIVSPILANIYLHELDEFMWEEINTFNRGKRRRLDPLYNRISSTIANRRVRVKKLDEAGTVTSERKQLITDIKELTRSMQALPSKDPMDLNYRRLNYVRYADDFLIGVIGSKADAVALLAKVRAFLKDTLHLDVSEDKTGIVKATDGARFLGYDIQTKTGSRVARLQRDGYVSTTRSPGERIIFRTPAEKLNAFCNKHGYGDYASAKGTHRGALIHSSDYEIVSIFNAEIRGLANYYRMDKRVKTRMHKLAWVANQSLMLTLASKHSTTVAKVLQRLRRPNGRHVVRHESESGKAIEVVVWLLPDLRDVGRPALQAEVDKGPVGAFLATTRTDVTARLTAGECENVLCTSPTGTPIQVHHVNAMANVGQANGLEWLASARTRKTRYLCINCHPMVRTNARQRHVKYANGEPDAVKMASPVRGGGALQPSSAELPCLGKLSA